MAFASWIRRLQRGNQRIERRPKRRSFSPKLELLEDRINPNSVLWIATSAGNWSTGTNWIDETTLANHAPGSTDIAVFDNTMNVSGNAGTNSNSTIDSSFAGSVQGISIANYTGTITDSLSSLTVGASGYSQTAAGSTFSAGANTVHVSGNWAQTGGTFTAGTGTVDFNGAGAQSVNATSAFNNVNESGGGTLSLAAALTVNGTLNVSSGTVDLAAHAASLGGLTGSGTVTDSGAAVNLTMNNSVLDIFDGSITGSINLVKQGSGNFVLHGSNSYGNTLVSAGTLQVGAGDALGTLGTGSITDNATLSFHRSDNITISTNITGTGTLDQFSTLGGTLTLTGTNSYGATTIEAGTLQIGNGGTAGTLGTGGVSDNAALVFDHSDTIIVSNAISGSGSLSQIGSMTLILTGGNSYGTTSITAGVLQVGNAGTTGTLGTGTVTDNTSLVFNRTNTYVVANTINGSGTVTQAGTGTTVFTGNNGYLGTTTISAGTLQLGNGGTSGRLGSTAQVFDNGTLSFDRSDTIQIDNLISGTGAVTQIGSGTTILTANNSYVNTVISAGTLQIGNGGTTGTLGSDGVTDNAALVFDRSDSPSVGNLISGTGSVSQSGTGNLTLTNANTWTGSTFVNAGTLTITGSLTGDASAGSGIFLTANGVALTGGGGTGTISGANRGVTVNANVLFAVIQGFAHITNVGGTAITVASGASASILSNADLKTGTNLNSTGIDVNGGTAFIQNNVISSDGTANRIGLLAENGAIVDAGQVLTPNNGIDFTGLGNLGHSTTSLGTGSTGNNNFTGYLPGATASGGAIVNTNSNAQNAQPGPQGEGVFPGVFDVLAQNDNFLGFVLTTGPAGTDYTPVENLIYHDVDNPGVGFVNYVTPASQRPATIGMPLFYNTSPNDNPFQRSMIKSVRINFDDFVVFTGSPISITRLPSLADGVTGPPVTATATATWNGTTVFDVMTGEFRYVFNFSGSSTDPSGSLADGNYRADFNFSVVHALNANGWTPTATTTPPIFFTRLFGDTVNNSGGEPTDGMVTGFTQGMAAFADLAVFNAAYRSRRGMASYVDWLDYNNDGVIDVTDQQQFTRRLNKYPTHI
jgi:autotransporter-associated beta strand protein